jgi:pSer/pThr/pTyr-binding forkhead associated (FHA) protein
MEAITEPTMPNTSDPQDHGSGTPLAAFRRDARALSLEDFQDRHGNAFLMLTAAELRRPDGPAMTEVNLAGFDDMPSERTAGLSQLVYRLRRTGRSAGHLVTLGRTANNDVVVPDLSVSRFHAFAKEIDGGRITLQDAGSTNGTTVNSNSVPSQGNGPPVELKAGDNVRLGQVELTFMDGHAFAEHLRAHD